MDMRKLIFSGAFLQLLSVAGFMPAAAQVTITGPTCVVPGTTYQYLIGGKWDSASTMQVCLQGAVIARLNGPCTGNVEPFSSILVIWNAGITTGSLNLTSSSGSSGLTVTVTSPLQAGVIASGSAFYTITYNTAPATIPCGPDAGGSGHSAYTHQWQESTDNVRWTDIAQATGQDLTSPPVLRQSSFFRRKTVESGSGTTVYSNSAAVVVGPPPPGTTTFTITGSNPQ
jgi:hypothetical protein